MLLSVLLLVSGCNEPNPVPRDAEKPSALAPGTSPEPTSEERVQELMALGYLDVTRETVEPGEPVVSAYDPERSAPGYNLISNRFHATAELLDAHGKTVHSWSPPGVKLFSNVELQPNGDLLVSGVVTENGKGFLMLLSFDGDVLMFEKIGSHHDSESTPDGRIASLTRTFRKIPSVSKTTEVRDNGIAIVDAGGRITEQHSLTDLMQSDPGIFSFQRLPRMNKENQRPLIDLLHTNSIEFMRYPELGDRHRLYEAGNVLVSIRHQDTVAVIDWDEKELLWAWGQGELSGQHDAQQLENGNFLIFDNGLKNQRSRIVEVDPVRRKIVWEYPQPGQPSFFTFANGSSQRLPNGNTLIANSDHGEAFEVTREGEIVWHFRNPRTDSEGHRSTIVRIKRYPLEWIEPLLEAH